MQRIARQSDAELITQAYRVIPARIAARLEATHFLTRARPSFVGLHNYTEASYERSYESCMHVAYPHHQTLVRSRRATTVVMPVPEKVSYAQVVHELGHVLHEAVGFSYRAQPTTWYSKDNHHEAFAESFLLWCLAVKYPRWWEPGMDELWRDKRTVALFESLA